MNEELIRRAQRGDREAFALLATPLAKRFLGVARRILRDLDLAQDATQQALIATWQDLPRLADPARFDAWSYRLLVRICYAEGRRERRHATNLRLLPVTPQTVDDDAGSVIDRDELQAAFRRLSIDHQLTQRLGVSWTRVDKGIAEIVGIPVGTAKSRLHRSLGILRSSMADEVASPSLAKGTPA